MTTIRPERPEDAAAIAAVVEGAFGSPAEATLVDDLRASPHYVPGWSLVADDGGEVVGHVLVTWCTLRDGDVERRVANLSPLAVRPDRQRQGIGGRLVHEVVARVDAAGEPLVVLEGDPRYYGRLGFEHSVPHGIHIALPSWAPPEASQVRRLAAYDPAYRGQVVYPAPFDAVADHS